MCVNIVLLSHRLLLISPWSGLPSMPRLYFTINAAHVGFHAFSSDRFGVLIPPSSSLLRRIVFFVKLIRDICFSSCLSALISKSLLYSPLLYDACNFFLVFYVL